ncbi:MAG: tRNA N6-adenosine threonylcarbamoyltransferase [Bacteriovoracaceae bacterium]|nr:tRNA N6-adenosine threonylcarbamoyltransferase [Bacteriovoracaceae bacterium]
MVHLLAFESSCDDTSVAVLRAEEGDSIPKLLSLSVQSQWDVHAKYGGVVPELASRAHLQNIVPCLEKVLSEANLKISDIDFFAATQQPGLIGCLLIGHTAAKTLSMLYKKPLISCHHIEGHLMSIHLENTPEFPYLTLVVSGGHTSLYLVKSLDEYELLGFAIDDAAGEAFDKGAKLLGLPLPGGPEIDKLAALGDPKKYRFGKVNTPLFNFSFSGIKSELVRIKNREAENLSPKDAAASYQSAILDHLFNKIESATKTYKTNRVAFVGGVACNSELRRRAHQPGFLTPYFPDLRFCTDNAAMIGVLGYRKFLRREFSDLTSDVISTSRPSFRKTA